MRTELPTCQSDAFQFKLMYQTVMHLLMQNVTLPLALCTHVSVSQKVLMNEGTKAIGLSTHLVMIDSCDSIAMEMIGKQIDCQSGLEYFCRYDYDQISIREIAHNEMFLQFMQLVSEIVELISYWKNTGDERKAKARLAEMGELMANCFVLFKFAHVPLDCINPGTLLEIMPLVRFQKIGVGKLDKHLSEDLQNMRSNFKSQEAQIQEARRVFLLYHEQFISPIEKRLKKNYLLEVAKYN